MDNRKHNNILISTAGKFLCIVLLSFVLVLGAFYADVAAEIDTSFLYTLSNFSGTVPYSWGKIFADKKRDEIYVLYDNAISVFNSSGMEVYRFGEDLDVGIITDATVDQEGNILLVTFRNWRLKHEIIRCNFRGVPKGKLEIKDLPAEFTGFSPDRIIYRNGNLYIASFRKKKVIVTTPNGQFKTGYDIASLLGLNGKEGQTKELDGFSVDGDGNILFTIPVLFKAFIVSPDGKVTAFGQAGGAPGLFGVVSGIESDSMGHYLVADKIKNCVMIFDRNHQFLAQFGYYGVGPESLVRPGDLAIDSQDRVYVTNGARRGISVFKITNSN